MAAAVTGFTLAWMVDTGIYMLAALLVYAAMFFYQQRRNLALAVASLLGILVLAFGIAFTIFLSLQPQAVFHGDFWHNQFEFASLFVQGWGALPMTDGLKENQFFAFLMGFAIPLVYVFTLIYVGTMCFLRKLSVDNILPVILCVYGLGQYHYFIHRSGVTSYDAVCIPLVLVICYWMAKALDILRPKRRRLCLLALCAMMLGALTTSYLFTHYPNALNLSGLDWTPEKEFYNRSFDFKEDAALITQRTQPQEPVALISSFETKILQQAGRKPYFYYFPLVESSHMDSKEIRGLYLHTKPRMNTTLKELESYPPPFIFVEKKLLEHKDQQALGMLLNYVAAHYTPDADGRYLTAFKRK